MTSTVNHDKAETEIQAAERPRRYEVGVSGWMMPKVFTASRMETDANKDVVFRNDDGEIVFLVPTRHVQYIQVDEKPSTKVAADQ